jgi:hypothetical protein
MFVRVTDPDNGELIFTGNHKDGIAVLQILVGVTLIMPLPEKLGKFTVMDGVPAPLTMDDPKGSVQVYPVAPDRGAMENGTFCEPLQTV